MIDFSGIWVPIVTPFADGKVDYISAQKLAIGLSHKGIGGLVVCGTTGEASSLTQAEKMCLVESVVDAVHGYSPVVMGLGGGNTAKVTANARAFEKTGIGGYMISAPSYVRPASRESSSIFGISRRRSICRLSFTTTPSARA